MERLRAAVAGAGSIGRTHTEALQRLGVEVVGLLRSTPEKGLASARDLGVARAYSDFAELVADPSVDVVHVCTPNYLHLPMASAAMRAGKHVICEKPLTMDAKESSELVRLSRDTGRVCATCFNRRYFPLCQEARQRVQAGEIGDIWMVHGEYAQDWLFLPTDWNWRLEPGIGGAARTVSDIGSHWLDLVEWLTGLRVSALVADFATFIPRRFKPMRQEGTLARRGRKAKAVEEVRVDTEDCATLLLSFDNGAKGQVMLSQTCAGHKDGFRFELNGSRASVSWSAEKPDELWIGHREQPNEIIARDGGARHRGRRVAGYPDHADAYTDTFAELFKAVYAYIAHGDFSLRSSFPTVEDGHRQMVLCEAAQQSVRERRWVDVAKTRDSPR